MGFKIIKDNEYLVYTQKNPHTNKNVAKKMHIPCFVGLACVVANISGYISPMPCFGFAYGVLAGYCITECLLDQRFTIMKEDVTENNQAPVIIRQPRNNNETLFHTDTSTTRHR